MDQKHDLTNDLDAIEKLSDLKKKGVITEEEFLEKKKAILGSNPEDSHHKLHLTNQPDEEKLLKKIKNVGSSVEALGWLEVVIIIVIFIAQFVYKTHIFGFFGNSILVVSSILAIILGRRIKQLNDKNTKSYLITLLVVFFVSFILVIADGGHIGILGIIIIYLIQAIRATKKLEEFGIYEEKFNGKTHTINKAGWIIYSVIGILLIICGLYVDSQNYNSATNNEINTITTTSTKSDSWLVFNSVDDGFKVNFPKYPEKEVGEPNKVNNITMQYTIYTSSEGENDTYMLSVFNYDNTPSNYNVKNGLEGMINGFVNNIDGGEITSSSYSTFGNYQAIDFVVSVPKQNMVFTGKAIIRNDLPTIKAYLILAGATTGTTTKYDQFVNSFAFTN